ncbi:hypothetical protein [Butyrivibrio sp. VCD2006]|uniref:hypothetical protein n=1 Tax=Butyrivibrio sp. VCD2006 TaxID=1280664 RepID=UPI000428335C|nr:hypothetical protein [Butyrivibrio sp. VCD2006]
MKEKFMKLSKAMFVIAAFLLVFSTGKTSAKASVGSVTQIGQTTNSITISWTKNGNETVYLGYSYIDDIEGRNAAKAMAESMSTPVSGTSYTLSVPQNGIAYIALTTTSRLGPITYNKKFKCAPSQVTNVHQTEWYRAAHSCVYEWNNQPCADGYETVFMDAKGNIIESTTRPSSRYYHDGVKNNKVYKCQVRAYTDINDRPEQRIYGEWSPEAYFLTQPGAAPKYGNVSLGLDVHCSKGKLKISWEKVDDISGYHVFVATKKGGKFKKVKTLKAGAKSITIKKFKKKKINPKKKYYVFVQAFKDANGIRYNSGMNYISYNNGKYSSFMYADSWN